MRARALSFVALLAAILLLHLLLLAAMPSWVSSEFAPLPPRLAVQLRQPMALKPPPSHREPPSPRLASPPLDRPGATASVDTSDLPDLSLPLPPLPKLPESGEDEAGPEWPLSTRLRYSLTGFYRGPVHGDAEVEWLRRGRQYQVRLLVSVGPRLAPFMSRQMLSEGELGPRGIQPRRYDEETRMLFNTRQVQLLLPPGQVLYPGGRVEAAPAGVQDSASQFVQLTWLLLTGRELAAPGRSITLPLALPQRLYPAWRYEIPGRETVPTPLGAIEAWVLRPVVSDRRGLLLATVWLAPSLQYLPVRIRIEQDENSWVDLVLAEAPLQEGPDNPPIPPGDPKP